jgi:cysteine synthase
LNYSALFFWLYRAAVAVEDAKVEEENRAARGEVAVVPQHLDAKALRDQREAAADLARLSKEDPELASAVSGWTDAANEQAHEDTTGTTSSTSADETPEP